jgi:protein-S-isoprenylcysteine O-methyltransferase Ste14
MSNKQAETQTSPKKMSIGSLVGNILATALFFPALILLLAGNWGWVEGWIFALWMVVMILSTTIYLFFKDPALLAERARRPNAENQKAWDKVLILVIFVIAIAWLVIIPLDAERFQWSPEFPLWLKILGGLLLIPALYFLVKPAIDNTFLSAMVRVQSERKQRVITTGTYGFVRHPLYLGAALMMLGMPLMVGSVYGFVLSVVGTFIVAGRILGEEKMMIEELEGYEDYKKKVKYRLFPYIW